VGRLANADVTQVVEELVGPGHLPARYVKRVRRMTPSLSALVAYLATDLDLPALGLGHKTHVYACVAGELVPVPGPGRSRAGC
jgi:prolycopene isomerase